ncbi:MAG: hypothetical protein F6K45_19165 [Kamptonema sp. SIO1D9]|nr:hypothetical protein [Kamptonema sp. SIO1D9]
MAARRDARLLISPLGEYYEDLLALDAWINARSKANQANSLLCSKLQEREGRIKERIEYLAKKRGIDSEELQLQILKGEAQRLTPDDLPDSLE